MNLFAQILALCALAAFPDEGVEASKSKALAPFQAELLDLAFQAASAFPTNPHIKNRCKAQESVVQACLEMEQPQLALAYTEKIDNWRQGSAYADLAIYYAKRGDAAKTPQLLERANKIAEKTNAEEEGEPAANAVNWQRDRICAKIAQAHAILGHDKEAAQFEEGVNDSEIGKVATVRAERDSSASFESQIEAVEKVVASGNFDLTKNALEVCARIFARFYGEAEKRDRAEKTIKASWKKLPIAVRIELMMHMANTALERKDMSKASSLTEEARGILDSVAWNAEDRIPYVAALAKLRFRSGDAKKARAEADAAAALFSESREKIVNIYRARALRPLAEAYFVMGDKDAALATYALAVAEGVENPNSRPRADDLVATCRSLASLGLEPDEELWKKLRQIRKDLREPW